jgi:hypothetical protein
MLKTGFFSNPLPNPTAERHAVALAALYAPLGWGALTVLYQLGQLCGWSDELNRAGWLIADALNRAERQRLEVAA